MYQRNLSNPDLELRKRKMNEQVLLLPYPEVKRKNGLTEEENDLMMLNLTHPRYLFIILIVYLQ